jgi:uncharacterized repeat protein (TIGR03803 family)
MQRADADYVPGRLVSFNLLLVSFLPIVFLLIASSAFAASTEQTLYTFKGGSDGRSPQATLLADKSGNLYGTTFEGGGSANCSNGCGTVFELSPPVTLGGKWTEIVLHSFQNGADGANPMTPLVADSSGNLYGSTYQGGSGNCSNVQLSGCGTIFELSPSSGTNTSWTYQVVYSFQGVPSGTGNGDGAWPGGLVYTKRGDIFGFAYSGGACSTDETGTYCGGALFMLRPTAGNSWAESVVFRFTSPYYPIGDPLFNNYGDIYGAGPGGAYGYGAVFALYSRNRTERELVPLYDFHGTAGDGAFPTSLIGANDALVGTTMGSPSGSYSNIFAVTPGLEWTESVLFNFNPISTGYEPGTTPILGSGGQLFGTTTQGGASNEGAVYQLIPPAIQGGQWTENVVYSFTTGSDGFAPYGGLIFGNGGALYGTTSAGGDASCNCGTVFRVNP